MFLKVVFVFRLRVFAIHTPPAPFFSNLNIFLSNSSSSFFFPGHINFNHAAKDSLLLLLLSLLERGFPLVFIILYQYV